MRKSKKRVDTRLKPVILKTVMREKPTNWQDGFTAPHKLSTGEVPFQINGNWYLYVYNTEIKDQEVFSYSEDRFYSYEDFQSFVESVKIPVSKIIERSR